MLWGQPITRTLLSLISDTNSNCPWQINPFKKDQHLTKFGAGQLTKAPGNPLTFMGSVISWSGFFICWMAGKLLLDNEISDWVFIVIICNVLVPAGHRQDYDFVVIGVHKPLVTGSSHLDDLIL